MVVLQHLLAGVDLSARQTDSVFQAGDMELLGPSSGQHSLCLTKKKAGSITGTTNKAARQSIRRQTTQIREKGNK